MKSIADNIVKNQDGTYRLELRLQMNNSGNLVESKVIIPRATIYVDDNHCIRIKELLSDLESDGTIIYFLTQDNSLTREREGARNEMISKESVNFVGTRSMK